MATTELKERTKEELLQEITELKKLISKLEIEHSHSFQPNSGKESDLQKLVNESSHDLIFVHDTDGRILALNKVISDLLPEQKFSDMREILVPNVRHHFDDYLTRIKLNSSDKGYMKIYARDGHERILKYNNKLVLNDDSEPIIQGLAHDITELWEANKNLKASHLSYKGLFDSSDDAIFILDQKGKIISANKTAQESYKKDEKRFLGKQYLQVALKNIPESLKLSYKLRRTWNGDTQKLELSGKLPNDIPFTKEVTLKKGKYYGEDVIICQERDVTERKLAEVKMRNEIALKKTEEKLHKVFEKINLVGLILDSNEKITYSNIALARLLGKKPKELIGKRPTHIFTPDKKYKRGEFFRDMANGGFTNKFEWKLLSKYQDERTLQFTVTPMTSPMGEIVGLTMLGEDVTENKRMVRALRESNEKLRGLFENANDLIVGFSPDGKISFVNQSWKTTLLFTDQDLQTLKFWEIITEDSLGKFQKYLNEVDANKRSNNIDLKFLTKEKKHVYAVGSVSCIFKNDKVIEYRGIFYNNTDKVRSERSQNLYNSIAVLALEVKNLDTLFMEIHKLMKSVIEVNNFHVALYEKDSHKLEYPYYVDEQLGHFTNSTGENRITYDALTDYTLRTGKALFLLENQIIQLASEGKIKLSGRIPKIWIGVPLSLQGNIIGAIGVKSYNDINKYRERHFNMLTFASDQIALSIERTRREGMIRNQTAKLKAIFETSSHLIWTVTRDRVLTSFNQNYSDAVFQQYGIRPAIGLTVTKNIPILAGDEFKTIVNIKYDEAFDGNPQHLETKIKSIDGKEYWWESFFNPIYEPDGSINEVSIISHNITEKKQIELAVIQSEEKFKNIFLSFQDIYFRSDIEGNITLVSPSVFEICGFTPKELQSRNISELYTSQNKQTRLIRELLTTGSVRNYEINLLKKDGTYLNCISHLRIIYQNQKPVSIAGVVRDITELKKASEEILQAKELAERSLKVKEVFLANMSHEIRTPMNGIIGMIDLLSESELNERQKEFVQTIKKSSETLLDILNDILDLSKLEAGKMELRPIPISLTNTIEKLYALFKQQATKKGIHFDYEIDPATPNFILADETRLLQILSNLVSNSIKFTDKGYLKVKIQPEHSQAPQHLLRVEVQDSGIGISEEDIHKLFATFQQLDNSSTKNYKGTGLGLSISRQLTHLMGGEIGVISSVGEGSTFWFTFHTQESGVAIEKTEETENRIFKFTHYSPRVLLVDDNAINLKVAGEILAFAGCEAECVSNGQSAIAKVKEGNFFDVVMMDVQMPDMDGITATQHIKALPLMRIPPIIAMTAYSMIDDREKFLKSGMDDYVSKPIKADIFLLKIKEWIEKQQPNMKNFTSIVQAKNKKSNSIQQEEIVEEDAVVDHHILESLRKLGGDDLIQETYTELVAESQEQILKSLKALENKDYDTIKRELHTLKGNTGTLGVLKISKLAEAIEKRIKNGEFEHLLIHLENLLSLWKEYKNYFDTHIKHQP